MKSKKKAIILLAVIILAIAATVVANRRLTQKLDKLYGEEQHFFEMGETVPFADNYLSKDKVSVDGYSLRVDNAEVSHATNCLAVLARQKKASLHYPAETSQSSRKRFASLRQHLPMRIAAQTVSA